MQNLTKNYIPQEHKKYSSDITVSEMKKIGDMYAGKDKYIFVNDCNTTIFCKKIREYLSFIKIPFVA